MDAGNESDSESTNSNESIENGNLFEILQNEITAPDVHNDEQQPNEDSSSDTPTHDFDLNLPTAHSYLGDNLQELRGRTILDEGIYVNLPLLVQKSVVLFPGQTLPMTVFQPNVINMLEKCINKNRTFGVVCVTNNQANPVGTTAEIYEYMQGSPDEGFCIKAKGRQRFRILRMKQEYGEITADVKIIPEIVLPPPFYDQRLMSLDNQRINLLENVSSNDKTKQEKINRIESTLTYWPSWVYKQYDAFKLANSVRQHLQFIETKGSYIPTDPVDLSYWAAQNLPFDNDERIMLLRNDCAILSLQRQLKYLTKNRVLVCLKCGTRIAQQSDLFPMSKEGPQSTFCNQGGHIFDTITLYHAENLEFSGSPPSAEYSWFPGYCWTIVICKTCRSHLGWKFTADTDKRLKPQSFWGLTRKGLKSKKVTKNNIKTSVTNSDTTQTDSTDED